MKKNETGGHVHRIGKYEIVKTQYVNRDTSVFKARDPDLDREVAIKLYHGELSSKARERLTSEGRALARIDSEYVSRCFSSENLNDTPLLVSEWIEGVTLNDFVDQAPLTFSKIRELFYKIALGLDQIHKNGLLHRDLKPSNVMIANSEHPKIIDMGLAQLQSESDFEIAGTRAYLAPEVARGEKDSIGVETDIFGLGSILYFLLTNQPLYEGNSAANTTELAKRCEIELPTKSDSNIPKDLAAVCSKCLEDNPEDRFRSVEEVLSALSINQSKSLVLGSAVAVVALLLVSLAFFWKGSSPETPPDKTIEQLARPGFTYKGEPSQVAFKGDYKSAIELAETNSQQINTAGFEGQLEFRSNLSFRAQCSVLNRDIDGAIALYEELIDFESQLPVTDQKDIWLRQSTALCNELKQLKDLLSDEEFSNQLCDASVSLHAGEFWGTRGNDPVSAYQKTKEGIQMLEQLAQAVPEIKSNLVYVEAQEQLINRLYFIGARTGHDKKLVQLRNEYDRIFGKTNMRTVIICEKQFASSLNNGDWPAADEAIAEMKEISRKVFPLDHQYNLLIEIKAAQLLTQKGEPAKAVEILESLAAKHDQQLKDKLQSGQVGIHLAEAYFKAGDFESSESSLRKAMAIISANKESGALAARFMVRAQQLLAEIKTKQGNYDEAVDIARAIILMASSVKGSSSYANLQLDLALALEKNGQMRQALIECQSAAVSIRQASQQEVERLNLQDSDYSIVIERQSIPILKKLLEYQLVDNQVRNATDTILEITDLVERLGANPLFKDQAKPISNDIRATIEPFATSVTHDKEFRSSISKLNKLAGTDFNKN